MLFFIYYAHLRDKDTKKNNRRAGIGEKYIRNMRAKRIFPSKIGIFPLTLGDFLLLLYCLFVPLHRETIQSMNH